MKVLMIQEALWVRGYEFCSLLRGGESFYSCQVSAAKNPFKMMFLGAAPNFLISLLCRFASRFHQTRLCCCDCSATGGVCVACFCLRPLRRVSCMSQKRLRCLENMPRVYFWPRQRSAARSRSDRAESPQTRGINLKAFQNKTCPLWTEKADNIVEDVTS